MNRTASVRLRVISNNVRLPNVSEAVPLGEYEGHIDWTGPADDPHMKAAQLILDQKAASQMGKAADIPSMSCEVLRYLKSGDIVVLD
jgi:hypothetical protein